MKTLTKDLQDTQKQMIKRFLSHQKELGLIEDVEEFDRKFNQYVGSVELGKPILKLRNQGGEGIEGQIISAPMNETFQEIYIDFLTVFNQINEVDNMASRYEQISQSSFRQLSNRVKSIRDTLTQYEEILRYREVKDMLFESFYVYSDTVNENVYTDRFGEGIAKGYRVHYKQENDCIELPLVTQTNQLVQDNGLRLAKAKIGTQFGSGFTVIKNPETSVDKLLDTSKETHWSETILTDEPLEIEHGELQDSSTGVHHYYVRHGALCELVIEYDYPTHINEIELLPFSEFPMDVVAIKYYEHIMGEEKEHFLVDKLAKEELKGKTSRDIIRYQFPEILTQKLVIVLNQTHYVKTEYHVPDKAKQEILTWLMTKGEWDLKDEMIFKPIYFNKSELQPAFVNFVKSTSNNDLSKVLGFDNKVARPTVVQKYEYQYGLYQLNTYKNEYKEMGVYVSPWITTEESVKRVRLDSKEYLPTVTADGVEVPIADIEYYITYHKNPTSEKDWFPLCPASNKEITAEKLEISLVGGNYVAKTRFQAKEIIKIRRNGTELNNSDYALSNGELLLAEWDRYATYTVHYIPDVSSYLVDFESMLEEAKWAGTSDELIRNHRLEVRGTDQQGVIELPHNPYVDINTVFDSYDLNPNWNPSFLTQEYVPIRVWLVDEEGYKIKQPQNEEELKSKEQVWLMNMTNYQDIESQNLEPFNPKLLNYQYSINGNKIQFNTRIPTTTKIFVEYPYYVSGFHVKAILRRNHPSYLGMTPILHEYRLYLED